MSVHAEQCRCVCARGQTPDEKEALAAIKEAYDLGINFWDVAPFYGGGSAERVPPAASPLPRERVAPPRHPTRIGLTGWKELLRIARPASLQPRSCCKARGAWRASPRHSCFGCWAYPLSHLPHNFSRGWAGWLVACQQSAAGRPPRLSGQTKAASAPRQALTAGLRASAQLLGRGLRGFPRERVVVSTKVGKYGPGQPADFSAARVTRRRAAVPSY